MQTQQIMYECKPLMCIVCGGIGQDMEQCRQKKMEVAKAKLIPQKKWVPKGRMKEPSSQADPKKVPESVVGPNLISGLTPIVEEREAEGQQVVLEKNVHETQEGKQAGSIEDKEVDEIQMQDGKALEGIGVQGTEVSSLDPN